MSYTLHAVILSSMCLPQSHAWDTVYPLDLVVHRLFVPPTPKRRHPTRRSHWFQLIAHTQGVYLRGISRPTHRGTIEVGSDPPTPKGGNWWEMLQPPHVCLMLEISDYLSYVDGIALIGTHPSNQHSSSSGAFTLCLDIGRYTPRIT